jgi:hypothetical protein
VITSTSGRHLTATMNSPPSVAISVDFFAGFRSSLPQQAQHAAGEDFRQLLAALDEGQGGRRGYGGCRHGLAAPDGLMSADGQPSN